MATLIRPKRWSQKPALGTQINWGHPLASGLTFCAVMNEMGGTPTDLVRGLRGSIGSGTSWGPRGAQYASGDFFTFPANDQALLQASGLTVVSRIMLSSVPSITQCCGLSVGSGNAPGPFDTWVSGSTWQSFRLDPAAVSSGAPSLGASLAANVRYTFGLTYAAATKGTNPGMYFSAAEQAPKQLQAPTASSGSVATGSGNIWRLGKRADGATVLPGIQEFLYVWGRPLTPGELGWLYAEPYAFMQPQSPQRRYWVVPAGGLANVWSGSAWVQKPAMVWNGSAWVQKPVEVWTGSAWKVST